MKTAKIIFWVSTIIFAAFMIFSSIGSVTGDPKAIEFITKLGYPDYFIPFIGVAKILGCIAILIPGYYRLKEWAYAGLFFDLIGAVYSLVKVHGFDASMSIMFLTIAIGVVSYLYYHKLYGKRVVAH